MINLALIWHHHQPFYRDALAPGPGCFRLPWVRLHAIRDYFSVAHLAALHPGLRLTLNFSAGLLMQIVEYVERGATDRAWELSRTPAERLSESERGEILATFFDADWHNQIFIHPRYRSLFEQRRDARAFAPQDLRDLQAWFNLAWFGKELREGSVALPGGDRASVAHLVRKGSGFTHDEIEELLFEQMKVLRAIVPLHGALWEERRIELSATPLFHPILPLLIDTDRATVDRPGAALPPRFAHPEDAAAQVEKARLDFRRWFGRAPAGAWPAEGAVSEAAAALFARAGFRWIASDQGVLARSGRWGYEAHRALVRHRAYRIETADGPLAIFFRDTELSDDIGFRLQTRPAQEAAAAWVSRLKDRARDEWGSEEAIVTVVLDGENAWGAYRDDGRPFLHALYAAIVADPELRTVTPSAILDGDPAEGLGAHPLETVARVHELFTGSWIDEAGSAPGVDLGTWIGEGEENQAWALLGQAREELSDGLDVAVSGMSRSYRALLAAEGSDWFWWFGGDQESGHDFDFDALFRAHLANAYRALGKAVPDWLSVPIVPKEVVWTFADPIATIFAGDALTVRTNCPGLVRWTLTPLGEAGEVHVHLVGGVMAGARRHQARLGPFVHPGELDFTFHCQHPGCSGQDACSRPESARVTIRSRG